MIFYFLDNHLHSGEGITEPDPMGFIRIFETPNLDIEKYTDRVFLKKIVYAIGYERKNDSYKIVLNEDHLKMLHYCVHKEIDFDSIQDMFQNKNLAKIFLTKKLAFSTVHNIINNLITQFDITLTMKNRILKKEEKRYNEFSKMLRKVNGIK